ncbi:MAG: RNA polymerase sigma factor [Planctomycetota bacterium]|jgi:RNA polymerase sigma-70 factor (ECF subfamily)
MKLGHTPDEWLMQQVARGGREGHDMLVRRHAGSFLTFITRMSGDRQLSEDLFQEVFLTVWIKRRQFDPSRRFKPWLYRIAANRCRAAFRRRSLSAPLLPTDDPAALIPAANPSPAETALATERSCLVTAAVGMLPEKQRLVLVLRIWSKLAYTEIAEILGRSEATVRSNMHHALAGLRAFLEPRMR